MAGSNGGPPPVTEKRHSLRYYRELENRNLGNNNDELKIKLDDNSNQYTSLANGGTGGIRSTKANIQLHSPTSPGPISPQDGSGIKELRSLSSLGSGSKYIPLSERNNSTLNNNISSGDAGLTGSSRLQVSGLRQSTYLGS